MGSVNSVFLPTTNSTTGTTNTANAAGTDNTTALANQSTFLKLLVAQLQNQDPTQPVDGTTFVTQLAEFSNVEQNLGTRQDLDAISEQYLGVPTPPSATSSSSTDSTDSSQQL